MIAFLCATAVTFATLFLGNLIMLRGDIGLAILCTAEMALMTVPLIGIAACVGFLASVAIHLS